MSQPATRVMRPGLAERFSTRRGLSHNHRSSQLGYLRRPMKSFSIIPVLDLKRGRVVRARAGDRANYQPIVTPLSPTSEAADVLRGLQGLARFSAMYIADLDAIAGEAGHGDVLRKLAAAAPDV